MSAISPRLPPGGARRWTARARLWSALYLLLLPTVAGKLLFTYYPNLAVFKYSLYLWDGSMTEEFVGLRNFQQAFADDLFWQTFGLIGILLAANLLKMWPSILTAVVLHRLRSERWQYAYRVLFVIPMVIPGLVWLLIWKSFYDPNVGILNTLLQHTGLIHALQWLDTAAPALAAALTPWRARLVDALFGSVWGLAATAGLLLLATAGWRTWRRQWFLVALALVAAAVVLGVTRGAILMVLTAAVGWWVSRQGLVAQRRARRAAAAMLAVAVFFVMTTLVWNEPTRAFVTGSPAWLGHSKLVIPAVIFWGFPWVGTVGVLIYLAGLQNISKDVYEAAELDGVGPLSKLWRIELPLILTQVRINLIFMTIGTLTDFGFFLILLGPSGGPGNKGMVPGLYMYTEAFVNGRFGYACALGLVMFVIVLGLTILYQKYVKVEK